MALEGVDTGRLGRLYTLIAFVTAVFLLTATELFSGTLLSIAVVAIGAITMVTAIIGFVTAAVGSIDAEP